MGMVTLHLVIGVGVFLMPLFLLLFSTLAIPDFDFDYGKSFTPHMAMQGLSSVDHTNTALDHSHRHFCVPPFSSHDRVNISPLWNLAIQRVKTQNSRRMSHLGDLPFQ